MKKILILICALIFTFPTVTKAEQSNNIAQNNIMKIRAKDYSYVFDKVDGLRIGGEFNKYIANMWIELEKGWIPKNNYTKQEYDFIKNNKWEFISSHYISFSHLVSSPLLVEYIPYRYPSK